MSWNPFRRRKVTQAADAHQFTESLVAGRPSNQAPAPGTSGAHEGIVAPITGATPVFDLPQPKRRTIACVVVHGMGQQVPFETCGALAEAFVAGKTPRSVRPNRVQLTPGAEMLSRFELDCDDKNGKPIDLHIYEGYWAPLTEGKVTFYESLRFLLSGALRGIQTCISNWMKGESSFSRWMFGGMQSLGIKPGTFRDLLITLGVLLFGLGIAVLINAEIKHLIETFKKLTFPHQLWPFLAAVLAGAAKYVPLTLILAAGAIYVYYLHYFLIEYVGDVAIYISSYKVSKFEEVRTAIQKAVFRVGQQVYQAQTMLGSGPPLYDRVIIVGHSLGSVIAYDLLNELIVWDRMCNNMALDVEGRTSNLITFGSPLDKTAFLFRTQISPEHHYREALAGLEQPLILDYRLRPTNFKWENLYSKNDIVSGRLIYYDLPKAAAGQNRVINIEAKGLLPIYAHVQYWTRPDLRRILQSAL
jgi:hypothetical protein